MNTTLNLEFNLFSSIDRYNIPSLLKDLDVVKSANTFVNSINEQAEKGWLDKELYNDFHYLEYLNYIPLDILKSTVKDLYKSYLDEFQYGNIEDFIKNKFDWFLWEVKRFREILFTGHYDIWEQIDNINFYGFIYPNEYRGYNFYLLPTKSKDDTHFYLLYLDAIISFFENELGKSLLNENSINNQKVKTTNPVSLNKLSSNKYKTIFTNDFGYSLFLELHKIYKDRSSTHLAHYSFLFYALQKDELIICKNIEFVNFLSEYDIHISKINSNQYGENKKYDLYNSIKENYNLSTL